MFKKDKEDSKDLNILARRSIDNVGDIKTTIGPDIVVKGEIQGQQNVKLEGSFDGKAVLGGLFFIAQTGDFKGDLSADVIVVEGKFEGVVKAKKKIELRKESHFKGNIHSASIAIDEGCFFEGEIKMNEDKVKSFSYEEKRKIKTQE